LVRKSFTASELDSAGAAAIAVVGFFYDRVNSAMICEETAFIWPSDGQSFFIITVEFRYGKERKR
jgi:hypothetical protein